MAKIQTGSSVHKLHRLLWPILTAYFLMLTLAEIMFDWPLARFATGGVILLCLATLARALVMATHFHQAKNKRLSILSLALALLIILAALIGQFA